MPRSRYEEDCEDLINNPRRWLVTQTLSDPAGDHDWVIEATVDLDASDEAGEPVLATTALRRL